MHRRIGRVENSAEIYQCENPHFDNSSDSDPPLSGQEASAECGDWEDPELTIEIPDIDEALEICVEGFAQHPSVAQAERTDDEEADPMISLHLVDSRGRFTATIGPRITHTLCVDASPKLNGDRTPKSYPDAGHKWSRRDEENWADLHMSIDVIYQEVWLERYNNPDKSEFFYDI